MGLGEACPENCVLSSAGSRDFYGQQLGRTRDLLPCFMAVGVSHGSPKPLNPKPLNPKPQTLLCGSGYKRLQQKRL